MLDPVPVPQKNNRWILILVILGIVLTAFFGFRVFQSYARIRLGGLQPGTTDVEAIRGWMTVPYIAKIYKLPASYLYRQAGVPASGNDEKSLADLNKEFYFGRQGLVLQMVKDAIRAYQPSSTPPRSDQ